MATWGAYLSSYVRKAPALPVEEDFDRPSTFIIKPYKPQPRDGPSEDSFGLKRSETKAKKLYASPAEPTTSAIELPERATSNATRLANMFGYAKPIPVPVAIGGVSEALKAAQAESKLGGKAQHVVDLSRSSVLDEVNNAQAKGEPPSFRWRRQDSVDLARVAAAIETDARQARRPEPEFEKRIHPQQNLGKETVGSLTSRRLRSTLDKEERSTGSPVRQEKASRFNSTNPSISSLDDLMSLLENESFVPKSPKSDRNKTSSQASARLGPKFGSNVPKTSLSSLDKIMNSLEQDWSVGSGGRKDSFSSQTASATTSTKDSSRAKTFLEKLGVVSVPTEVVGNMEGQEDTDIQTNTSQYRKDSFTSVFRGDSFKSSARRYSFSSSISSVYSEPRSISDNKYNIATPIFEDDVEPIEGSSDKPLLDYILEVSEMALERQRMSLERKQILQEELSIQRESERFAEEEEQMQRFVESLQREEQADAENAERKRRIAEQKRIEEEAEQKRLQDLEDERTAVELAEQLNKENERIEREKSEKERKERERLYQERVEMERNSYVAEEARLRQERMEEERRAREEEMEARARDEEGARLEAKWREEEEMAEREIRAQKKRLQRERYEEETRRMEYEEIAQEERRTANMEAERLRYEEQENQRDFQRRDKERITQESRRVERQRNEQMRYEEEDPEPEVLTKEQELAKAEEKIRAAFEGLAQERGQLSRGPSAVGSEVKDATSGLNVAVERQRGVSRYNTVASGERPRQENPISISRGNTVGMRPSNAIGLPSRSKAKGLGLPSNPRSGLPSGPRPRRNI